MEEMLCAYAGVHFPFILLFLSELHGSPLSGCEIRFNMGWGGDEALPKCQQQVRAAVLRTGLKISGLGVVVEPSFLPTALVVCKFEMQLARPVCVL